MKFGRVGLQRACASLTRAMEFVQQSLTDVENNTKNTNIAAESP